MLALKNFVQALLSFDDFNTQDELQTIVLQTLRVQNKVHFVAQRATQQATILLTDNTQSGATVVSTITSVMQKWGIFLEQQEKKNRDSCTTLRLNFERNIALLSATQLFVHLTKIVSLIRDICYIHFLSSDLL